MKVPYSLTPSLYLKLISEKAFSTQLASTTVLGVCAPASHEAAAINVSSRPPLSIVRQMLHWFV